MRRINFYSFVIVLFLFGYSCIGYGQQNSAQDADKNQSEESADWMQDLHNTIANSVYQSAYWFDSFFIDAQQEQSAPQTQARIRLTWAPRSRDYSEFKARFRLKVRLPHFKNRMDLILSDDADEELSQLPLESSKSRNDFNQERFSAALRYLGKRDDKSLTDYRLGITGGDIFVRARYQRNYLWQDKHSIRFEPAAYYFLDDGLGARLLVEYDYQLSEHKQLRFDYSTRVSEAFSGVRWKHGFYYLRHWSDKSASIWALQLEGQRNGERGFLTENITVSYRYRFNAIKDWLFFEVEPFLEWPEIESRKTTPGIALRVEGYFNKSG